MNLAELIDEVVENTATEKNYSVIRDRLNRCMDRISTQLGVPERYVTDVSVTEPFMLPDEAWRKGLKYAEDVERQREIPIYTVREANMLYPRWEDAEELAWGIKFIVFDRANTSAPVYPVGFDPGDKLRIIYHIQPAPMLQDEDEPFAVIEEGERTPGQFDGYHIALAQYVSFQLLLREQPNIAASFYADYQSLLTRFNADVNREAFYPKPASRSHNRWYQGPEWGWRRME